MEGVGVGLHFLGWWVLEVLGAADGANGGSIYIHIYMVRNYIKLKDMVVGFANGNLV